MDLQARCLYPGRDLPVMGITHSYLHNPGYLSNDPHFPETSSFSSILGRTGDGPLSQDSTMAEVIGFLREDATYGEKQPLKLLSKNLPEEFSVYVESTSHKKSDIWLIHRFKGLEAEVVFIPHLQQSFLQEDEDEIAAERRILYMAMSRAREKLYMTYFGKLPRRYEDLRRQGPADFVG